MRSGSNIRLRADGRWEARYIKGKDEAGKTLYGFVYAYSREDAEYKRSEALRALMTDSETAERMMKSELATMNPEILSSAAKRKNKPYKFFDALPEETALKVEQAFLEQQGGVKIGFLTCLYMGLSLSEVCSLKYSDFKDGVLTVERVMLQNKNENGKIIYSVSREIPTPIFFTPILHQNPLADSDCYVLTDSENPIDKPLIALNLCRKITSNAGLGKIHPDAFRSTFIRRALTSSLNIETVSALTGIDSSMLRRRFSGYMQADKNKIQSIYENYLPVQEQHRQMNLLILGAGSHGHAVREIAEQLGVFQKIAFLDDNISGENILGKCSEFRQFTEYSAAFVAIGNSDVRKHYAELLSKAGLILPRIISPDANIAKNVEIEEGTVVMPQATVSTEVKIGKFSIIASNSTIGFRSVIGDFAHTDCASVVQKEAVVPDFTVVESGEIYRAQNIEKIS